MAEGFCVAALEGEVRATVPAALAGDVLAVDVWGIGCRHYSENLARLSSSCDSCERYDEGLWFL